MKKKVKITILVICVIVLAVLIFGFMGKLKDRPLRKGPIPPNGEIQQSGEVPPSEETQTNDEIHQSEENQQNEETVSEMPDASQDINEEVE